MQLSPVQSGSSPSALSQKQLSPISDGGSGACLRSLLSQGQCAIFHTYIGAAESPAPGDQIRNYIFQYLEIMTTTIPKRGKVKSRHKAIRKKVDCARCD